MLWGRIPYVAAIACITKLPNLNSNDDGALCFVTTPERGDAGACCHSGGVQLEQGWLNAGLTYQDISKGANVVEFLGIPTFKLRS
jgi:hypothetical protein